jgi:signal transduction histidine kinase
MIYAKAITTESDLLDASERVRLAARDVGLPPADQACLAAAICALAEPVLAGDAVGRVEVETTQKPAALVVRWYVGARDGSVSALPEPPLSLLQPIFDRVVVSAAGATNGGRVVEITSVVTPGIRRSPGAAPAATGPAAAGDVAGGWAQALASQARGLLESLANEKRAQIEAESHAASFAHDVKNPLSVIKTGAAILLKDAGEPRTRAKLESILRATSRIGQLVDEAMDLAGLRSGRLRLDRGSYDVGRLLEEALSRTRPYALQKNVQLEAPAVPASGARVRCDGERVLRALVSLIMAMLKASAEGARIEIVARLERGDLTIVAEVPTEDMLAGDPENLGFGRAFGIVAGREILRAHGGHLGVRIEQPRLLAYTLTLPARDVTGA